MIVLFLLLYDAFMIRTEHLDRLDNIIVVFTLSLDQNLSGEKTQPLSKGIFFLVKWSG
jgi:hypothetical protein